MSVNKVILIGHIGKEFLEGKGINFNTNPINYE